MVVHRLSDAATLLGVSDDTLRRWMDQGRFTSNLTEQGKAGITGEELARLAVEVDATPLSGSGDRSVRNRIRGIVTSVKKDAVMAQVEMASGPTRIVSLISREAAEDLELEPGTIAWATVKSTNVSIEV